MSCIVSADGTDNYRLACEVQLSSISKASLLSMPGADYDSAINAHICCCGIPECPSGYVPGMLVAYENQALSTR